MDLRDSPHLENATSVDAVASPARPLLIAALSVVLVGVLGWFGFGRNTDTASAPALVQAPAPATPGSDGPARQSAGAIAGDAAKPNALAAAAAKATAPLAATPASAANASAAPGLKMDAEFASARRLVPFAFNKVGVGPRGTLAIKELAPLARQAEKVYVRGRTDGLGNTEANRKVALDRAYTVYHAFLREGVQKPKLRLTYCSSCFVASNDTQEGRRLNRRVEVELLMPPDDIARLPKPVHAPEAPPPLIAPLASSEILQTIPR